MAVPLRLLIVEDSENDAQLIVREIQRGGYAVEFQRVETAPAMRTALARQTWDLVISDYSLPSFNAPAALDLLKTSGIDLPFIILSGSIGEETAVAALKAGAHDFMIKNNLTRLIPAIQRELSDAETRRVRRQAEKALGEAEARNRTLIEQLPMIVYVNSPGDISQTTYISPQVEAVLGYTPQEWIADPKFWQKVLYPEDRQRVMERLKHINHDRSNHSIWNIECSPPTGTSSGYVTRRSLSWIQKGTHYTGRV